MVTNQSADISRVMDKAQAADRLALFAGLQAAVGLLVDLKYGEPWPDDAFLRLERAIDNGRPYGFGGGT